MKPIWKPLAVVIAALVVAGAGVLLVSSPAAAHTDFVGSDPRDGASLDEIPRELQLEFSDDMDPALSTVTLQVQGGGTTSLELRSGANRNVLRAAVPTSLDPEQGTTSAWMISFRVVSRDGHPVAGTTQFVVRTPESAPATGSASRSSSPQDGASPDPREDSSAANTKTAEQSDARRSPGREVWPLAAVGVGVLVLMALAVGAVMRAVRQEPET